MKTLLGSSLSLPRPSNGLWRVEFWHGFQDDVDPDEIVRSVVPIKGKIYKNPLRFLEIFANLPLELPNNDRGDLLSWRTIRREFMPRIPDVHFVLGEEVQQPPFTWKECSAYELAVNFSYTTNGICRIISNLHTQGLVPAEHVDSLIDRACLRLASIYRANNSFVMRNMNNNFQMFLIPRVIESLVGKATYNSDMQEYPLVRRSLQIALDMAQDYIHLDTMQKMAVALGKGVAFIEKRLTPDGLPRNEQQEVEASAYRYYDKPLAIDDRQLLIDKIANACTHLQGFVLTAILDDASETVDDLLWMLDLMEQYPFFQVKLLANTAQVSVNFSSQMLDDVLKEPIFRGLGARLGGQFQVVEMYCPFTSFQTNALPLVARQTIRASDAVFVKGASFFETCQIVEKDAFYAFVVFGSLSRLYSGLQDYDPVFAYVPAGKFGYIHHKNQVHVRTLRKLVAGRHLLYLP